ncbi:MAG: hypothetical protein HW402_388 [Dehalococcoidales bacterium]|nr:hypothetical protein [Dehalococcoidales bacterium]
MPRNVGYELPGEAVGVRIKICSVYQPVMNGAEAIEVDGSTIDECLRVLISKYPALEKLMYDGKGILSSCLMISLNGQAVLPGEMNRPVKDDDEIFPFIMIGGG